MHHLAVLALPDVVAFDLSTPAQVFGNEPGRYVFTACGASPGRVPSTTGFAIDVPRGLGALAEADTVLVPGLRPAQWPPPAEVLDALRAARARGARVA
ncbi:MAG: AraC family transcriptional regulator, partial [Solirubrobacteraceae bacterium]